MRRWFAPLLAALPACCLIPAEARGGTSPFSGDPGPAMAHVVIAHDPQATAVFAPRRERVRTLFDRGLTRLLGKPTAREAWLSLVTTNDVVGLKVYSVPGPICGTRPAVAAAAIEGLLDAGLPPRQIIVWDRQYADLQQAGFTHFIARYGVRVEGSIAAGYDPAVFYDSPLLGSLIWSDSEFGRVAETVGRNSYVSKLVSQTITKHVNLSALINHNLLGVAGNLYSLASGSVDNFQRFESDPQRLAVAVPEIYALPALSDRVVLNVTDALLAQYLGERHGLLHYSTTLNELRFSRDPVALDVLALEELDRQRQFLGIARPRRRFDAYQNAALLELGLCETNRIQIETLRVP